jgi:hypothetical protein
VTISRAVPRLCYPAGLVTRWICSGRKAFSHAIEVTLEPQRRRDAPINSAQYVMGDLASIENVCASVRASCNVEHSSSLLQPAGGLLLQIPM